MNLYSIAYHFFDYLAKHIKKYDGLKGLRTVIRQLFGLWNNNRCRLFEVQQPITEVNTSVCYIDNISSVLGIA